jgi:hypothetical protein
LKIHSTCTEWGKKYLGPVVGGNTGEKNDNVVHFDLCCEKKTTKPDDGRDRARNGG